MEPSVVDVFAVREFHHAYATMPSLRAVIDQELDRRTASWLTVPTMPVAA